jgi:SAM-dependent methyltransferase
MAHSLTSPLKPIHPFPARMAPEIALAETRDLPTGSIVLDPMTGSGTVVRFASEQGHHALAVDSDPLAALMTRVWTTPICTDRLRSIGSQVSREAAQTDPEFVQLPWIDNDPETSEFVDYWFGPSQKADLRRLSSRILRIRGPIGDALMLSLSRLIITKKRGASLAWDISHSRPHKKKQENDFPVLSEFIKSVEFLAKRLEDQPPPGNVHVLLGDARQLRFVADGYVDAVLTSPPYLNAIDYLRGHKFSLVWMGLSISDLRSKRSNNVGSEKRSDRSSEDKFLREFCLAVPFIERLTSREQKIFHRYILDLTAVLTEMHRVLKPGGKAVLVVGNSTLKGIFVDNALAVKTAAARLGLVRNGSYERDLPANRRYLPPPSDNETSDLSKRMRTESVLSFIKP